MKKNPDTKLLKSIKSLTDSVQLAIAQIDAKMKDPYAVDRGQKIAIICNVLEAQNNAIRHDILGIKRDKKGRK